VATYDDFSRLEIRVGTITEVQEFPEARKPAWKLRIDFGEHGARRSSAQLTTLYTAEMLLGRQVLAVTNFPPKQVGPFISEVLVLGVPGSGGEVVLLQPERPVANGSLVG
jgi:tRNA-binding protein